MRSSSPGSPLRAVPGFTKFAPVSPVFPWGFTGFPMGLHGCNVMEFPPGRLTRFSHWLCHSGNRRQTRFSTARYARKGPEMPILTNIQTLMLKVWQRAAESGSGELTLSYASENDARRIRTSLYQVRKTLLNAPDTDPAVSIMLEDLSIRTHWPTPAEQSEGQRWGLTIFSQSACGAFAQTAEALGVSLGSIASDESEERLKKLFTTDSELSAPEKASGEGGFTGPVEFVTLPNKFF